MPKTLLLAGLRAVARRLPAPVRQRLRVAVDDAVGVARRESPAERIVRKAVADGRRLHA